MFVCIVSDVRMCVCMYVSYQMERTSIDLLMLEGKKAGKKSIQTVFCCTTWTCTHFGWQVRDNYDEDVDIGLTAYGGGDAVGFDDGDFM